ncbi:ornithine cyclodeaminase [Brucella cytisi]|uniref:ornithine cyclodeaminase n=2 Tax=Brucella cytisi TaxID=407152 RepID=UPI0035BC735A
MMITLNAHQTDAALDYPGLIEALRQAHASGKRPQCDTTVLRDRQSADNQFVSLVAWLEGEAVAVKLVGVFPANVKLPVAQPSIQGTVTLFSGQTGEALMVCDGAIETFKKTAADSALGASLLARKDARTLLVVGAGGLAPHVVQAHCASRPSIGQVFVWNRNFDRAEKLASRIDIAGVNIVAVEDLDNTVSKADVISCVTMSTSPLVKGKLLKEGAHVDLIGAYMPDMREADDDVFRRAERVFVDTRHCCDGSGELGIPLATGLINREQIEADLIELCQAKHPGRSDDRQITVYKNVGGGHLDLFTAQYLYSTL